MGSVPVVEDAMTLRHCGKSAASISVCATKKLIHATESGMIVSNDALNIEEQISLCKIPSHNHFAAPETSGRV